MQIQIPGTKTAIAGTRSCKIAGNVFSDEGRKYRRNFSGVSFKVAGGLTPSYRPKRVESTLRFSRALKRSLCLLYERVVLKSNESVDARGAHVKG